MKYFKIIKDKEFIGVGTTRNMRKFQKKYNRFLACDENAAQYIQIGEEFYHAVWMEPVDADASKDAIIADVIRIEEDEYNTLVSAIESNEDIVIVEDDDQIPELEPIVDEVEQITIEYIKKSKILELENKIAELQERLAALEK